MPPVMGVSGLSDGRVPSHSLQPRSCLPRLFPRVLYYVALFIQADLEAAKLGIRRVPADRRSRQAGR